MKKNEAWRELIVAGLASLLSLAPMAAEPQEKVTQLASTKAETTRKSSQISALEKEESQGKPKEDIKVHGQWNVVVRNADGSIASRHEFQNSLQDATIVNELLTHQAINPKWWVYLKFTGSSQIWILTPDPSSTPSLAVYVPSSGANENKLVLTGTVPGTRASGGVGYFLSGQLIYVGTQLYVTCAPNATCDETQASFTSRDLTVATPPDTTPPAPITVQPGQGLDVTVVLSFQ